MTGISAVLIAAGIVVLLAAMTRTQWLIGILKEHGPWASLRNLMAFFAIGYAVYGVLLVARRSFNKDLIVAEVFFLSAVFILLVVRYAYQTIHDIMRLDELEQLANTDELTNLYNRRAIMRLLEEEFWKARRFGFPLSVAMVDLDHFKMINDEFGHLAGDTVLREASRSLRGTLRNIDLLGRYGGEEFLCVLPSTPAEGAYITGERIRSGAASLRFKRGADGELESVGREFSPEDDEVITISVSVGIATVDGTSKNPAELLAIADAALYMAKEMGRDRTCTHLDLAEREKAQSVAA